MKFIFVSSLIFFSLQAQAQRADNVYVDGVIADTLNSLYGQSVNMPDESRARSCSLFGSSHGGFHRWGKSTFLEAKLNQTGPESYAWNARIPYRCEYSYRHFDACLGIEDTSIDIDDILTIDASFVFGEDNILQITSVNKSLPPLASLEKMGGDAIGRCGDALIDIMRARLNGLRISD